MDAQDSRSRDTVNELVPPYEPAKVGQVVLTAPPRIGHIIIPRYGPNEIMLTQEDQ